MTIRAELDVWAKLLDAGPVEVKPIIAQTLQHWKEDSDLASLRDESELAKLPEAERAAFKTLWEDVDRQLKKAAGAEPQTPPM